MAEELSPSLALIFTVSLQQGKSPQDWKKALVTPLFMKGDQTNPTNYYSVSLPNFYLLQAIEHIIKYTQMSSYHVSLNHNIISDAQYGFCKRRSTELQLATSYHP